MYFLVFTAVIYSTCPASVVIRKWPEDQINCQAGFLKFQASLKVAAQKVLVDAELCLLDKLESICDTLQKNSNS